MGLYLAVFDGDNEIDGIEVGSYKDFGLLRDQVTANLENGKPGTQFPTLILHSDCDGSWTPSECESLLIELSIIAREFKIRPALPQSTNTWQADLMKTLGLKPATLFDSFIDVDGEPILERLPRLAMTALEFKRDILFQ